MDGLEMILKRRSVREYKDEEIPSEVLMKVLEAASWAPSSKNSQPWEFIIIRDKEKLGKLANVRFWAFPIAKAPMAIAVIVDPRKSKRFLLDGACATMNLMLAARYHGLGTCWIADMNRKEVKEVLGVPEDLYVVTVTPIGYPKEFPKPTPRKPLREVVYLEKYGRNI